MEQEIQKKGEVILYHPTETIKLEVRLENETVWLTQQQIADLFGTKRPAITKHLRNIYAEGELIEQGTCSILEHMGNDSKQKLNKQSKDIRKVIIVLRLYSAHIVTNLELKKKMLLKFLKVLDLEWELQNQHVVLLQV